MYLPAGAAYNDGIKATTQQKILINEPQKLFQSNNWQVLSDRVPSFAFNFTNTTISTILHTASSTQAMINRIFLLKLSFFR